MTSSPIWNRGGKRRVVWEVTWGQIGQFKKKQNKREMSKTTKETTSQLLLLLFSSFSLMYT
ncbi:Uncharacterized protein APZ42_021887 [Daphnia magna]|uniref:Uncharacterized protein n=1 Tax=Daphnia magna TaxID=35525 RepID=A0A164W964_9CRUS|nr:Uncharacterized protein APZ42_021887 [Daphnia magna]